MINQKDENGKKHGLWKAYHDNGKLWYKGEYKNGKSHGLWELYHENGKPIGKGEYKNNKDRGLWYEARLSD